MYARVDFIDYFVLVDSLTIGNVIAVNRNLVRPGWVSATLFSFLFVLRSDKSVLLTRQPGSCMGKTFILDFRKNACFAVLIFACITPCRLRTPSHFKGDCLQISLWGKRMIKRSRLFTSPPIHGLFLLCRRRNKLID